MLGEKSLRLLEKQSNNPRRKSALERNALIAMSEIAAQRNQWSQTVARSRALLKLDPKSVRGQSHLARALFHQGKAGEAYAALQVMREQNPGVLLPEITMGLLYEELVANGDTAKRENARRAMEAAVKAAPKDLAVRLIVAQWALDACLLTLSKANAQAALTIDPDSPEAHALIGIIARHEGEHSLAIASFQTALKEQPLRGDLATQLALAYLATGQMTTAQRYAQLAIRLASEKRTSAQAYTVLATAFHQQQKAPEANAALAQALTAPLDGEFALLAATLLVGQKQTQQAITLLSAAASSPCFPQAERLQKLKQQLQE